VTLGHSARTTHERRDARLLFDHPFCDYYDVLWEVPHANRTAAQRTFMIIMEFDGEVNNGGFEQFFSNRSGRDAPTTEACLREIGAECCADLMAKAFDVVAGSTIDWQNDLKRKERIRAMSDDAWYGLEDLNLIFYSNPDPLDELMARFIASHSKDFRFEAT
jgi:hypothetical protein